MKETLKQNYFFIKFELSLQQTSRTLAVSWVFFEGVCIVFSMLMDELRKNRYQDSLVLRIWPSYGKKKGMVDYSNQGPIFLQKKNFNV